MTIADSALTNPEPEPLPGSVHSPAFSLNEVFQERMRKAQGLHGHLHLVVRCEQLPHMEGNREEIGRLFDSMISMMVNPVPEGSKLFLHIDCQEVSFVSGEQHELSEKNAFQIRFYTNSAIDEAWKEVHAQALLRCQLIAAGHHGSFTLNHLRQTGCLFSLTIPGKIV
jgi:hypothetical protein